MKNLFLHIYCCLFHGQPKFVERKIRKVSITYVYKCEKCNNEHRKIYWFTE